jgi:hypothetical protein
MILRPAKQHGFSGMCPSLFGGWRIVDTGRVWVWVPALVVMGLGCLVNAARCGRLYC